MGGVAEKEAVRPESVYIIAQKYESAGAVKRARQIDQGQRVVRDRIRGGRAHSRRAKGNRPPDDAAVRPGF